MNQLKAFRDTIRLAEERRMPDLPGDDRGLQHLQSMLATVEASSFSPSKLGRWLGWAQCALVSANVGVSLADMKELNAKWTADDARAVSPLPTKAEMEPLVDDAIPASGPITAIELRQALEAQCAVAGGAVAGYVTVDSAVDLIELANALNYAIRPRMSPQGRASR